MKKQITANDLYELKTVSCPIVTKKSVFYIETKIREKENDYDASIHSIDLITKERTIWGDTGTKNLDPQISSDEKWLAFLSNANSNTLQIKIMPLSGGSSFQVTFDEKEISGLKWHPNGKSLFYVALIKKEIEKEGTDNEDKPEPITVKKLKYKQDGRGIVPENSSYALYRYDLETQETQEIFSKEFSFALDCISPNGQLLCYNHSRFPKDDHSFVEDAYLYDLMDKTVFPITEEFSKGQFQGAAFSPDGQYLLLQGNDFRYTVATQTNLYGFDIESHSFTCLTESVDLEIGDCITADFQQNTGTTKVYWQNEEEFLFPVTVWGKSAIYKGSKKGKIEPVFEKPVHITNFAILPDNQTLILAASVPTVPSVLWQVSLANDFIEVLLDPNKEYESEHHFASADEFTFKAPDGWDIQGWYMRPRLEEKKTSHPVILYIHGGPQVCYGETFFHEMQVHAGNGYGVILINPRGGNGYGQEFVQAVLGDYGNKDYLDLMTGLDRVLELHPEIDQGRVYVTGGSYGGFMTNWIVTHTDRFRAAVTQRSISNWVSFYGISDIGYYFTPWEMKAGMEDVAALWRFSPLAYAKEAKTPLLILHGEEDLRCPIEQAEQFYIALKAQGTETEMVRFPKSNHNLSRNGLPHLRIRRIECIRDWFKKYQ